MTQIHLGELKKFHLLCDYVVRTEKM